MDQPEQKTRTGLFPGSFNPVHIGHLIIAHHLLQYTDLEEIWFVISPHNPLKNSTELLPEKTRLELLKMAVEDQPGFSVCERERSMERPSYTYKTLDVLKNEFPERDFVLIIGSDNLEVFDQWKAYKKILAETDIYVYPRKGSPGSIFYNEQRVKAVEAPLVEISSTFIREAFRKGLDPRYLLPERVYRQIIAKQYIPKV
ncbi:MAG: nicotinate-nucleotide adenylyltransferase [Bacteroidales bacterium]|nr:nicotinate-nucleotide adenylyltransferase [Bacteroidales bacterium]